MEFDSGTFFTVTFRRPERESATAFTEGFSVNFSVNFGVKGKALDRMITIIHGLTEGQPLRVEQLASSFGVSQRTVYGDLRKLREWRLIEFQGAPKTGVYVITSEGIRTLRELGLRFER